MAIGFVLAWMSGEGLQPPSLPLCESRLPKGHQQAQRSDIGFGAKPFRRPRLVFLQRTRELQRCGSDAFAAVRPQAAAVARAALSRFAPAVAAHELPLLQIVRASSRCLLGAVLWTNAVPDSARGVKSFADPARDWSSSVM